MAGRGAREVLWNVGEGVTDLDLNNLQRFLRAQATDWDLASRGHWTTVGSVGVNALNPQSHLFVMGHSCAPHVLGATRTIDVNSGLIIQWRSGGPGSQGIDSYQPGVIDFDDWGQDPYALVYFAANNEFTTVHAVGDATNPRWDLVSIQLSTTAADAADQETRLVKNAGGVISSGPFIKRRKVIATKTVTQGTPAASPTIPAVPAGHVPLYAILVPANHNTTFPGTEDLFDFRVPLGSFVVDVLSRPEYERGSVAGAGADTLSNGAFGYVSSAAPGLHVMHMPLNVHGAHRLIGVGALVQDCPASDFKIKRSRTIDGGQQTALVDISSNSPGAHDLSTMLRGAGSAGGGLIQFEYRFGNLNLTTSLAGVPVWGNGWSVGMRQDTELDGTGALNSFFRLVLDWTANGAGGGRKIQMVRFYFAGGA